ncbi:hypothetical protein DENSPDRAFT_833639 [Dentipellis sp. KUC8613]|nr:hypothetical protein DENSPDRAFT_833639 [Dentipellis sp. KUC8613]
MWCTRWFIPLLILPLPTAPPFFLLLFIFSLTLHARPCFYCVTLLTALFISSCYWQPIPLDSALSHPWSENITTFADALSSSLDRPLKDEERATVLRLSDRCWCDMSPGVFGPFDLPKWERASVKQLKDKIEREERVARELAEAQARAEAEAEAEAQAQAETVEKSEDGAVETTLPAAEETHEEAAETHKSEPSPKRKGLFSRRTWFTPRSPDDAPPPPVPEPENFSSEVPPLETPQSEAPAPTPDTNAQEQTPANSTDSGRAQPSASEKPRPWRELPLLRKEYDLKAFGFDMVVDFGWPAS